MNRHIISIPFATAALLVATSLAGQYPGSRAYSSIQSGTTGISLGAYLNGTAARYEDDSTVESGPGIALRLGYGFTPNVEAFAELAGARVRHDGFGDRYGVGHFDVGMRYNFGTMAARTRPYLSGALSGRALTIDVVGADMRGAGLSAAGGLRYFFNPALALELNLGLTFGSLGEGRIQGGSWESLGDNSLNMLSSRFNVGLAWHP